MSGNIIEFYDFVPEVQDKILEYIYSKVDQPKENDRLGKLLENLKFLIPDECKNIIVELEDIILSNKVNIIRNTTFFILKNGEEIKRSLMGI